MLQRAAVFPDFFSPIIRNAGNFVHSKMTETEETAAVTMNGQPQPETGGDQLSPAPSLDKSQEMRKRMEAWLNQPMRIRMSDGRTLVGTFICTDKDRNVILGSCEEYVSPPDSPEKEEPRVLGLAMVPGQHIVSIEIDDSTGQSPPL